MGPLGKYSQQVAAFVAVFLVVAAVVFRFLDRTDTFVDQAALIALGAIFGAAASTAVNGNSITAAHRRLDIIDAPPAKALEDKALTEYEGPTR